MKLWELTGKEFEQHEARIAILPVGSVERHGDHLPLGTDGIIPLAIAEEVEKLAPHILVLPPVWYGSSTTLRKFAGTFDIPHETLYQYVLSILMEAARNGVKLLVVLNGHGGNTVALKLAAKKAAYTTGMTILVVNWWTDLARQARAQLFEHPGHAGEDETSVMLALMPDKIDMKSAFDHPTEYVDLPIYSRKIEERIYPRALSGSASKADGEKGRKWLIEMAKDLLDMINKAYVLTSQ